jgi:hypothetical protein
MKKITFIRLFLCCAVSFHSLTAQVIRPANAEISLLTAAAGNELYAVFGHSGLRVKDAAAGIDVVFNYGLFDFNQPNFYLNFARGRMNYRLGAEPFEHFVNMYARENRGVREQVFDLDSAQKTFIVEFLIENNKPENRHYLYHFFLDNCATRIRDLMLKAYDGLVLPEAKAHPTYRELVYDCTQSHLWGRFGIDIALGLPTDEKTDMYRQMFLPDYIFYAFAHATYNGRPIVKQTRDIFAPDKPQARRPGFFTPMVMCCLILALALLFSYLHKGARIFDFVLFFATGLVGLLVFALWFFTDHTDTHGNLNIIWALPAHAVAAFFLLRKERSPFIRKYFLAAAVIAMLLIVAWPLLPQKMNVALIPLTLALALRAFRNFRIIRWR